MHQDEASPRGSRYRIGLLSAWPPASSSNNSTRPRGRDGEDASTRTLVVENNPVATMTQTFNPFAATSTGKSVNATALFYEPLLQYNNTKAGQYYPWLAKSYSWNSDGTAAHVRPPVRCDVERRQAVHRRGRRLHVPMMQQHPELNYTGLPLTGEKTTGRTR